MTSPTIKIKPFIHRGNQSIGLYFAYDKKIIDIVKSIEGATWSASNKCWYFPKKTFRLKEIFDILKPHAYLDYSALQDNTTIVKQKNKPEKKSKVNIPEAYINLLDQKHYSENTKAIYLSYFGDFIRHFTSRDLSNIEKEEINSYILKLIREKSISASQQNQRINAIKFYYEKVLGRHKEYYEIERPRQEKKLPDVLSKQEVKMILESAENLKHKTIIALIYSCGIRRSEIVNLQIKELDFSRMLIKIIAAKGKKDRYVQLSPGLLPLLEDYLKKYEPKQFLFNGQTNLQYTGSSILKMLQKIAKKAGIKKRVYPHILRHSFATHHLEQGTDLRYIQEWLGHESSKTTEVYTHVTENSFKKFKNPLDDII